MGNACDSSLVLPTKLITKTDDHGMYCYLFFVIIDCSHYYLISSTAFFSDSRCDLNAVICAYCSVVFMQCSWNTGIEFRTFSMNSSLVSTTL